MLLGRPGAALKVTALVQRSHLRAPPCWLRPRRCGAICPSPGQPARRQACHLDCNYDCGELPFAAHLFQSFQSWVLLLKKNRALPDSAKNRELRRKEAPCHNHRRQLPSPELPYEYAPSFLPMPRWRCSLCRSAGMSWEMSTRKKKKREEFGIKGRHGSSPPSKNSGGRTAAAREFKKPAMGGG